MQSTRQAPPAPPDRALEHASEQAEVLALGAAGTLAFVVAQQATEQAAAAARVRAVCHWADLHRVTGVGAVDPEVADTLARDHGLLALDSHLGLEGELRLAHQGAFMVAEFAVCELAAALGMSEVAARGYVGQCVELRDRLPRLWGQTMAGRVPVWKALQVAKETLGLVAAAAEDVDVAVAPFVGGLSYLRIMRAVQAAIVRHDPEEAARRAAAAAEKRGVWVEHQLEGISRVEAVTDTPAAAAFDTALNTVAASLAALGDTDPPQVRRAKAIGVLADPQTALNLHGDAHPRPDAEKSAKTPVFEEAERPAGSVVEEADEGGRLETTPPAAGAASGPASRTRRPEPGIHIHLHTAALTGLGVHGSDSGAEIGGGLEPVARVAGFGPRPTAAVVRWLAGLAPGTVVKVTPVVDLAERISVDAYEAPERLRRLVEERDHTGCVFPWCGRQGRYDLDHLTPYVPMEDGGPPGQTNDRNLARLCRFHHRVKTHSDGWEYHRTLTGELIWSSPLGRRYRVDQHGTRPLDRPTLD